MKKICFITYTAIFCLIGILNATENSDIAALTPQMPGIDLKEKTPTPPPAKPQGKQQHIEVKQKVETPIRLPADTIEKTIYMHPGMITYRDSKWIGGDHLYNVSNNIPIAVELVLPEKLEIDITEEGIRNQVAEIFKSVDITTNFEYITGKPPLPFFHILIMMYPIDKGFVACCDGRLFENVHLDRVVLDPSTFIQAITWEKQSLLVFPEKQIKEQIDGAVNDIASTFAKRFEAYEKLRRTPTKELNHSLFCPLRP